MSSVASTSSASPLTAIFDAEIQTRPKLASEADVSIDLRNRSVTPLMRGEDPIADRIDDLVEPALVLKEKGTGGKGGEPVFSFDAGGDKGRVIQIQSAERRDAIINDFSKLKEILGESRDIRYHIDHHYIVAFNDKGEKSHYDLGPTEGLNKDWAAFRDEVNSLKNAGEWEKLSQLIKRGLGVFLPAKDLRRAMNQSGFNLDAFLIEKSGLMSLAKLLSGNGKAPLQFIELKGLQQQLLDLRRHMIDNTAYEAGSSNSPLSWGADDLGSSSGVHPFSMFPSEKVRGLFLQEGQIRKTLEKGTKGYNFVTSDQKLTKEGARAFNAMASARHFKQRVAAILQKEAAVKGEKLKTTPPGTDREALIAELAALQNALDEVKRVNTLAIDWTLMQLIRNVPFKDASGSEVIKTAGEWIQESTDYAEIFAKKSSDELNQHLNARSKLSPNEKRTGVQVGSLLFSYAKGMALSHGERRSLRLQNVLHHKDHGVSFSNEAQAENFFVANGLALEKGGDLSKTSLMQGLSLEMQKEIGSAFKTLKGMGPSVQAGDDYQEVMEQLIPRSGVSRLLHSMPTDRIGKLFALKKRH